MLTRSAVLFAAIAAVGRAYKYDNSAEAASIASGASSLGGAGNYYFTNVATGQTLSFVRTGVTNFLPTDDKNDPIAVQFNGNNQARLSGANNKCVSAQWQAIIGRGYDNAAVSYACTVGSGLLTGTDTLEKTKQWWYLLPSGSSDDSDSSDSGATDDTILLASSKSSSASSSTPSKDVSGVIPSDRSTWICKHDGAWLAAHPGYAEIHTECLDDLADYEASLRKRRIIRRRANLPKRQRSHAAMADKVKAKRSQATYFIIAVDHILDQQTRAIGSDVIVTPGGYQSTTLIPWDTSDQSQLWTITEA